MAEPLPERDWKLWQRLAPILLNRFCEQIVSKSATFSVQNSSGHEKFLDLYQFISLANDDIAVVFDNRRRSSAVIQIAAAVIRGIMSEEELDSFSQETQERVRALVAIGG